MYSTDSSSLLLIIYVLSGFPHVMFDVQENFVAVLKPLMQQFPQLGDPDDVDAGSVSEIVLRIQELLNKNKNQEPMFEVIKSAFSEIKVV